MSSRIKPSSMEERMKEHVRKGLAAAPALTRDQSRRLVILLGEKVGRS